MSDNESQFTKQSQYYRSQLRMLMDAALDSLAEHGYVQDWIVEAVDELPKEGDAYNETPAVTLIESASHD